VLQQLQKVLVCPEDLEYLARPVSPVTLVLLQHRMGPVYLAGLEYLELPEGPEDLALLQLQKGLEYLVSPECLVRLVALEVLALPVLLECPVDPV